MSPASYQTAPPRDAGDCRSTANDASPNLPCMQSGKRDSNPRPQPWQGCALPTELFPRNGRKVYPSGPVRATSVPRCHRDLTRSAPTAETGPWNGPGESGGEGDRTPDLVNAIHALSQLSYAPVILSRPDHLGAQARQHGKLSDFTRSRQAVPARTASRVPLSH